MQFERKNDFQIEKELMQHRVPIQNFPKSIDFPIPANYRKIVTQIKTMEISADCILYNSVEAVNESKEFRGGDYWCFGGTGQGDRWLFDQEGMVYFYNHDYDEGFDAMDITFNQWLQMADLCHQMEEHINNDTFTKTIQSQFDAILNEIHPNLSENYPFSI